MNRRLLMISGLAALAACASLPPSVPAPPGAGFELLEPVLAASTGPAGVTIRVRSEGCTTKADFAFFVERRGAGETLAFGRRRVDACKGPGGAVDLTFAYAELGLDPARPLFLMNPLARQSSPGGGGGPRSGGGGTPAPPPVAGTLGPRSRPSAVLPPPGED